MLDPLDPHHHDHDHDRKRPGPFAGLRASFLTGLVVVLPIALTILLLWNIVGWIDGVVLPLVPGAWRPEQYIGINLRGVGVIFFFLFTVLIGWIAKGLIGRSLLRWAEGLVDQMPVVRSIYNGLKQIAETVFAQQDSSFDKACIVEYPRKGIFAIGFVSTTAKGEISRVAGAGEPLLSVFVPTTPNPTSGFLLFFRESEVTMLDMSIEDAAKLVISAGLVYPEDKQREPAPVTRVPDRAVRESWR